MENNDKANNETVFEIYTNSDIEVLLPELIAENTRYKAALSRIAQGVSYVKPMDFISERMFLAGRDLSKVMQYIAKTALENK